MVNSKQEALLRVVRKVLFTMTALLLAIFLGNPLGVVLLFYYAYLVSFKFDALQKVYNRVGNSDMGLIHLWGWIKNTFISLLRK